MNEKRFILNADDFGMSKAFNRAVLDGYNNGFLTSASICANGKAFNAAVNEILPECPNLGIGVHLNIIEGRSLTKAPLLTNKKGKFNNGFLQLLLKSNNHEFLQQVEYEFRTQIETVMNYTKVDHIDSHVHTHAIPNLFKITAKLAKEYNIPQVRTQSEEMYFVPSIKKHINFKYPVNIIKIILLEAFTKNNKKLLKEMNLSTNDYLIGIGYTGIMDDMTLEYGLKAIEEDAVVEALIHPCNYARPTNNQHYKEFKITQNKELEDKIKRLGFEITNYKKQFVQK
ncbi:MAG: carbohydrate deacetylase [Candidatus Gastranaerophilaceae bacterium]